MTGRELPGMTDAEQTKVRVSFDYYPDDPDPDDPTGMTEEAHQELMDELAALGADNPTIEKVT
jgi:hypothetical protein